MAALNPLNLVKSAVWRAASALRESGQALERVGCRLQGIHSYEEMLGRHSPKVPVKYDAPSLGAGSFVAPSGLVLGNVALGNKCSVWYNAVIRGDHQPVTIGDNSNIQDNAYVGATSEYSPPVQIGSGVSIGHGAVVKGAKLGDNVLVGISAIVSEGCEVGSGSLIAAGSYVEEDTKVPSGEVWAGNPAKKLRDLKPAEKEYLKNLPERYTELADQHKEIMDLLKMKQHEYAA